MIRKILVFKTSVREHREVCHLKPVLDNLIHSNERWNFDLEDCDNILRVEAISTEPLSIIVNLQKAGFACSELDD